MSTLPFNFVVDWIMRRTTKDQFRGIRWKPFSYLKDLVYIFAKQVGLNISSKKIEIMALNTINTRSVQIDHEELPYTDIFTNLGSIIGRDKRTDLDIQSRLNKVRNSLKTMKRYGAPLFTVLAQSWNFITVTTWQPSCTAQNVGAWRRRIYQNSPHFRPRAYAFSGPISS